MADVIASKSYDDSHFTIRRNAVLNAVQAPAASLTSFAHFRSRNKCIVTHCIVTCTSLPSAATTWSLYVMRDGATTVKAHAVTSFSALGDDVSALVLTLASSGTLASVGNHMSLQMDTTEKGKFDVVWEYKFLP